MPLGWTHHGLWGTVAWARMQRQGLLGATEEDVLCGPVWPHVGCSPCLLMGSTMGFPGLTGSGAQHHPEPLLQQVKGLLLGGGPPDALAALLRGPTGILPSGRDVCPVRKILALKKVGFKRNEQGAAQAGMPGKWKAELLPASWHCTQSRRAEHLLRPRDPGTGAEASPAFVVNLPGRWWPSPSGCSPQGPSAPQGAWQSGSALQAPRGGSHVPATLT